MKYNNYQQGQKLISIPIESVQGSTCMIMGREHIIKSTKTFPCNTQVIYLDEMVIYLPGQTLQTEREEPQTNHIMSKEEYDVASEAAKEIKASSKEPFFRILYKQFSDSTKMQALGKPTLAGNLLIKKMPLFVGGICRY